MSSRRVWVVLAIALSAIGAAGCRSRPRMAMPAPPPIRVPAAMLSTPETTITAADSSFSLTPSQQIATPFWSQTCPASPTTETFAEALQGGARLVTVNTPHHPEPLHGILAFCPVPHDVTGPAARLHLVQVPPEYVVATEGGLISVVYEPVQTQIASGPNALCTNTCGSANDNECDDGGPNSLYSMCELGSDCNDCGPRAPAGGYSVPGWILYLSRQPFPVSAPVMGSVPPPAVQAPPPQPGEPEPLP